MTAGKKRTARVKSRKLGRYRAVGLCWPSGKVEVDVRLKGKPKLETLIHEFGHKLVKQTFPDFLKYLKKNFPPKIADEIEEIVVGQSSAHLADWLYENNVRIIDED